MLNMIGFEEAYRRLDRLRLNAEKLNGQHQVPAADLFPPEFMQHHTTLPDFDTLCREAGVDLSKGDAFEKGCESRLDDVVRRSSAFASWSEMKEAAVNEWAARQLVAGVDE